MADEWAREVGHWRAEFQAACLSDLRAFQSNPALAEAFDSMFDGTEVLPRGLVGEYEKAADAEPLAAGELLVPISSAQLAQLKRLGRARRQTKDGPMIVDAPYDAERGLELARTEE
jgi:hypothetical protein